MKILHVITSLKIGGAEKLMVDLLPRLRDKGCECALLTFDGERTPFRIKLEESGIIVYDFGKVRNFYSPKFIFKLLPYLRKYDIVHTHNTAPQLFVALGSLLCSVVLCTTEHNTSNRRRDLRWYAPIDRWMYSRYKDVICISYDTEKKLKGFIPNFPTTTSVIFNGIDIKKIRFSQKGRLGKDMFGCRIALIQVAGFRYQKDQDTVIKSLKHLPDDFHLFLVGDGERKYELESLTEKLGLKSRVHFLGIRTDIGGLLKDSDIVVMSSHWEGFGLAAVEGMAADKPVIATDIPGLREVVNGAGVLFEKSNENDLAKQIFNLTENPEYYEFIKERCSERAESFDISKMVEGYMSVYCKILS